MNESDLNSIIDLSDNLDLKTNKQTCEQSHEVHVRF